MKIGIFFLILSFTFACSPQPRMNKIIAINEFGPNITEDNVDDWIESIKKEEGMK